MNNQLEQLNSDIAKLVLAKSQIENKIAARIREWTRTKTQCIGARAGLTAYITIFALIAGLGPTWVLTIGKLTNVVGLTLTDMSAMLLGSSAIASLGAGGALWLISANSRTS